VRLRFGSPSHRNSSLDFHFSIFDCFPCLAKTRGLERNEQYLLSFLFAAFLFESLFFFCFFFSGTELPLEPDNVYIPALVLLPFIPPRVSAAPAAAARAETSSSSLAPHFSPREVSALSPVASPPLRARPILPLHETPSDHPRGFTFGFPVTSSALALPSFDSEPPLTPPPEHPSGPALAISPSPLRLPPPFLFPLPRGLRIAAVAVVGYGGHAAGLAVGLAALHARLAEPCARDAPMRWAAGAAAVIAIDAIFIQSLVAIAFAAVVRAVRDGMGAETKSVLT
jgi:hypothetical protein